MSFRHQVDVGQFQCVAAAGEEAGQARQREVLVSGRGSLPVQRQVEGHAAALGAELADHVPPRVTADANAVDEQRRAARPAGVDAARGTGPGVRLAAVLVEVFERATRLFAVHGYDGTSIEAVLADAGVSRGSLYHHFPGKDTLFLAVLEDVGARISGPVADAMRAAPDPVAALRIGCLAWIRLAGDPAVQQIMLIDAPAVLGWQRWRELDEQNLELIKAALTYAAGAGSIERRHVDTFAHIVLAALNEVALMIAR